MHYKMHEKSHIIIWLAIHLPLQQAVYDRDGNEERALQVGRDTTLTAFFSSMKRTKMHISTFTTKFQSIKHLTERTRDGIPDNDRMDPSSSEFIKYSHQTHNLLLSVYSFYIAKEPQHLWTLEQLMVKCMLLSKIRQEQWGSLKIILSTGVVCTKLQL